MKKWHLILIAALISVDAVYKIYIPVCIPAILDICWIINVIILHFRKASDGHFPERKLELVLKKYDFSHERRGVCIIINNEHFDKARTGMSL